MSPIYFFPTLEPKYTNEVLSCKLTTLYTWILKENSVNMQTDYSLVSIHEVLAKTQGSICKY